MFRNFVLAPSTVALCLALCACSPAAPVTPNPKPDPQPVPKVQLLGTLALQLESNSSATNTLIPLETGAALSLTPSNFLDIDALLEGSRYLSATFRLTTSWAKQHLSGLPASWAKQHLSGLPAPSSGKSGRLRFIAYVPNGQSTPFSNAQDALGQSIPLEKMQKLVAFAGTQDRAGTVVVDPLRDDLETLQDADRAALEESLQNKFTLSSYGFKARGCGKLSCAPSERLESRLLEPGADAQVTVGFKMPRGSGNPFRMTLNLVVLLEPEG